MRTIKKKFKKATSTPIGKIITLSILLLIVAAIAAGIIYWKVYRKQIIRHELENAISKKSGGLYSIRYDSLKLDEVAGNLSVSNMTLEYDSSKYVSLLNSNDAPPTLLNIYIPGIVISGVKTPQALLNKEIVGKKLHIVNPVINIIYTNAGKDSARSIPTSDVYKQILGDLDLIKIDTLEITGAQITTSSLKTGKKNVQFLNTSILLIDVAIDNQTGNKQNDLLFAKQLFLEAEKMSFPSMDQPYNYTVDSISLNSVAGTASVKKFRIIPLLNENAFVKSLPTQDDRFDFTFSNIGMRNLDIRQLFNENIVADSVFIGGASFKIYRDLSIPRDRKSRIGTYPHQLLGKLPVAVNVKTMILRNAFVEYKEKSAITLQSGKVQFHNISATISNVTNNKEAVRANNVMRADISTQFLGKAPMKVVWKFYLQNPKGRFDIKGNLGSITATEINPITEPMGPARLEDGTINSLQFNFDGNNYGTEGSVVMVYSDLKLALLEKDKGSKDLDKKSLTSFVANLVVKNHNPSRKDKGKPRVITVHFDRDTNRSIFHLVWKSIFKGIKETVGIKK
jgi:hypothetical protein